MPSQWPSRSAAEERETRITDLRVRVAGVATPLEELEAPKNSYRSAAGTGALVAAMVVATACGLAGAALLPQWPGAQEDGDAVETIVWPKPGALRGRTPPPQPALESSLEYFKKANRVQAPIPRLAAARYAVRAYIPPAPERPRAIGIQAPPATPAQRHLGDLTKSLLSGPWNKFKLRTSFSSQGNQR